MSRLLSRAKRAVSFKHENPEWADLAYEVLFRRDAKEPYDLQYAVAQALRLAWEMGRDGRSPPAAIRGQPRKMPPTWPDPVIDEVAGELAMLAWSPLAGTPQPPGYIRWFTDRDAEQRKARKVVVHKPAKDAKPVTRLVRRS